VARALRKSLRTPLAPFCLVVALTCSICGETAPCGISRATGRPWRPACQHRTAACSACGRLAPIASGTLADPLCAGCTGPAPWADCPVCSDPGHPNPGQARSTALFQLAAEIPAAILARTLGIHTDVAVTWQRLSAGDWTTYAADVSHRLEG
jgi:hypothetical protein